MLKLSNNNAVIYSHLIKEIVHSYIGGNCVYVFLIHTFSLREFVGILPIEIEIFATSHLSSEVLFMDL